MAVSARSAELEAAIVADPEDASAYLVYADWLQARGDPRGELVVVQHALETAQGPAWAKLRIRERELLTEHGEHLLGPVAAPRYWRHFDWRRGFVDRMHAAFVLDEGEQLIAHPSLALVRAVSNVEFPPIREAAPPLLNELAIEYEAPRTVLAQPRLRHLASTRHAWASGVAQTHDLANLETSSLETLAFRGDTELLQDLSSCPFPNLRVLRTACYDNEDIDEVLSFLLSTPHAELDLRLCTAEASTRLAILDDMQARRRIRALRLDETDLATLRGLRTQLRRLEILELSGIRDRAAAIVAELPVAPRLAHLVLEDELSDPEAVAALATSPCAATLRTLTLRLRDRVALAGLNRGCFTALRVLDIDWNDLAPSDAAALSDAFPCVEELIVDDFRLSTISDCPLASNVQTLTIQTSVGAARVDRWFAREIEKFRSLRVLRLAGEPVLTPAAFETLAGLRVAVELAPNVPPLASEV